MIGTLRPEWQCVSHCQMASSVPKRYAQARVAVPPTRGRTLKGQWQCRSGRPPGQRAPRPLPGCAPRGVIPSLARNGPSVNNGAFNQGLLERGQGRDDAKDDPRHVCGCQRHVSLLLTEAVYYPEGAVDGRDGWLDEVPLITCQVVHYLWDVGDIHHNRHKRCHPSEGSDLLLCHSVFPST